MAATELQEIPAKLSIPRHVSGRGGSYWCTAQGVTSFIRLVELLEARAGRNRTSKMWTENLVKTVIIIMNFSRGGHEGNWVLHLLAAEAMLPYFRATCCHNYTNYDACYVHHMKGLDPVMMKKLQYGAFVGHITGICNSTWTDMFIETTSNNIHADVTLTDRTNRGGYRLPSDGEVGS